MAHSPPRTCVRLKPQWPRSSEAKAKFPARGASPTRLQTPADLCLPWDTVSCKSLFLSPAPRLWHGLLLRKAEAQNAIFHFHYDAGPNIRSELSFWTPESLELLRHKTFSRLAIRAGDAPEIQSYLQLEGLDTFPLVFVWTSVWEQQKVVIFALSSSWLFQEYQENKGTKVKHDFVKANSHSLVNADTYLIHAKNSHRLALKVEKEK